jgi:hypothetical protein
MRASFQIEGFDEARKVLDVLPDKIQVQTIRKIFRKAAMPIIKDARSRVISYNPKLKKLADAIGFIPVRTNDPILLAGIRAKGAYKDKGYIGHWVEYGVSGIKKKTSRTLTREGDESFRFFVARIKKGERYRGDIAPQPFMRPAIDSKSNEVKKIVAVEMENHIHAETEKALRRYNVRKTAKAQRK